MKLPRSTILALALACLFGALAGWMAFGASTLAGVLAGLVGLAGFVGLAYEFNEAHRHVLQELAVHRQTEATLTSQIAEQRRTVDALAEGLDAALFICDLRATILYANPEACRLFGLTTPTGKTLIASTLSVELERLTLAAATEHAASQEITFTYPLERVGRAAAWRDPAEPRVFVTVYDITELRRLERSRRDFVANVSHELRTPMTIIRAYAETLLDEAPESDETAHRMLPRIIAEVDRLSSISQDLLVLSVAESNPVRKQRCEFAGVVKGIVAQLQAKAEEKGLDLSVTGPDELPIHANPAQVSQIVYNLVDNALNYTATGSVKVRLFTEGPQAVLEVEDTGIGIAEEFQGRVFERFYRVDRGRSRATGGTGLGLSIVRHVAEAHGGRITLTSALNRGSTFRVELPIG